YSTARRYPLAATRASNGGASAPDRGLVAREARVHGFGNALPSPPLLEPFGDDRALTLRPPRDDREDGSQRRNDVVRTCAPEVTCQPHRQEKPFELCAGPL